MSLDTHDSILWDLFMFCIAVLLIVALFFAALHGQDLKCARWSEDIETKQELEQWKRECLPVPEVCGVGECTP